MRFRAIPLIAVFLLAAGAAWSQSNDVLDVLLGQKQALYQEAAYLCLVGGGKIAETASAKEAFDAALSRKWLPAAAAATDPISLRALCYLGMKAFGIRGGISWTLFPGERSAYREIKARGLLQGFDPRKSSLSGEEAAALVGRMAALKGVPE